MKIDLRGNAVAATLEQVVVGGAYFVLYGLLIRSAGAELVGVFSLVLILTGISAMANAGFGSAASRFVPVFEGRGDRESSLRCIETTVLCTAALYAALLAIVYYPFRAMITAQAGGEHARLVADLMIPATAYAFLLGVGSATTAALTALQRSDLRAWANLTGTAVSLAVLFWGVPHYGIAAGLWALCTQAGVVLFLTWINLRRILPGLDMVPRRFDLPMARKLLALGANLQVQSLLVAALEPMSRLFIGQFGTLMDVTYFSMATRFVFQIRALVFSAAQPLLSAFSFLGERDAGALRALYARVSIIIGFASLLTLSATAGAAPFVGELWIGEKQDVFASYCALLAMGWLANTMALSSYFIAYSMGRMKWNLIAHVVMAALNLVAGFALGLMWGSVGVAAGMAIALAASGLVMGIGNARLMPEAQLGVRLHMALGVSAILAALAAVAGYEWLRPLWSPLISGLASGTIWLTLIAPAALLHPAFKLLMTSVRRASPV